MRKLSRVGVLVALGILGALLFAAWLDTRRTPTYESPWGAVTTESRAPPGSTSAPSGSSTPGNQRQRLR